MPIDSVRFLDACRSLPLPTNLHTFWVEAHPSSGCLCMRYFLIPFQACSGRRASTESHLPTPSRTSTFCGWYWSFSRLFFSQVYSVSIIEATLAPASGSQPLKDLVKDLQAACKDVGDLGASLLLLSKWFTVMFHNFPFYRGLYLAIRFCSRGRGS